MSATARELDYSTPQEVYEPGDGPAFAFPFSANGDYSTFTLQRRYKQTRAQFVTDQRANRYPLGTTLDPIYPSHLAEVAPTGLSLTGLQIFTRTFATIPLQQSVPSSFNLARPALAGDFPQAIGAYRVFQPDTTQLKYDAYAAQTVLSDGGVPAALYPSGGTYTLTFGAYTTAAIAYNAAFGTVQTALNALTSISDRGNVVVTGTYNSAAGFTITFNSYATLTLDTTLITADGTGAFYSNIFTGYNGYSQSPQVSPGFGAANISGGTFTITIFGQTTAAIAYNATAATVQAALNALSEVGKRGNCTVSTQLNGSTPFPTILAQLGGTGARYIGFSIAFANALLTSSVASLTPAGSAATLAFPASAFGGNIQTLVFSGGVTASRQLSVSAHGLVPTDSLYLKADGAYALFSGTFSAPSADTVLLIPNAGTTAATATAITEVGKRTKQNYKPGTKSTRTTEQTDFYLPGVSPGITALADIPAAVDQSDDATFLAAVFAGTASIAYRTGQWSTYLGPIVKQTTTLVAAADV